MNQTCKLAKSLLKGEVISIITGFQRFFITNVPREVSRSIEQKFGVKCDKKQINFKNKDGESGYYFEYRLLNTDENKPGIEKMENYIRETEQSEFKSLVKRGPKTIHVKVPEEKTEPQPLKQLDLFSLTPSACLWDLTIDLPH